MMPDQAYYDVFDSQGNRISRAPYTISDAEIKRTRAPDRLRQTYAALQNWADDARLASAAEQASSDGWAAATPAQKDAANRQLHTRMAVTFDRLAIFFERFSDVLLKDGLDQ